MKTVSVSRTADVSPELAVDRLRDLDALMDAAGFDEVHVDGDRVRVVNHVSLATMELTVSVIESDAALAYEQVDGIFEEMVTRYEVTESQGGDESGGAGDEREGATTLTATTEFAVGAGPLGDLLDATIIARQRRRELTAQLAYLAGE
ncbi:SRPBCC family protein [Halostella sp. JP-L12]|uniref:SRPBCC family protein n=1 Tax=Halostella TaxID=1843185 RepID=UPI000EF77E86|nr:MULTISPECIES: SRPBCC family protein [Halostella]NHN49852.1 SRPBCC family protein [Halostella sp. JP-L12]